MINTEDLGNFQFSKAIVHEGLFVNYMNVVCFPGVSMQSAHIQNTKAVAQSIARF